MRAAPYAFDLLENCSACTWRDKRFFCDLDAAALKDFDVLTFTNVYPPGAMLFAEGQAPRGVFLLCRGSVKLSISAGDGKTVISHIATAGEVLGLSSTVTGNAYKTTAETLEPSQINFVRREDFVRLLARSASSCANAVHQLSHECEVNMDHIRALGLSHSAAEKLANVLLRWCDEQGKPSENGTRVQLLMTHEDISQLIGTSRETVTRLLKDFRDRKILSVRGSTLIIHDKAALQEMVLL
jgi:CRP/FNR family transcriptional regulator, cyclic AMP receptor protein